MDVLVKYPTRGRPAIFRSTLDLYLRDPTVKVLVTVDLDDATMNNADMRGWIDNQPRVKARWGNCKSKIEAVNDGVAEEDWRISILASDDMTPIKPNYAQMIAAIFDEKFPFGDGVLHLNDGRAGRSLNTLCILDRKYFDRFGYIYHPAYYSLWADNEFQEVSESLRRSVYVDEILIRHDWIDITGKDALHRRNETYQADKMIFMDRKAKGFPNDVA